MIDAVLVAQPDDSFPFHSKQVAQRTGAAFEVIRGEGVCRIPVAAHGGEAVAVESGQVVVDFQEFAFVLITITDFFQISKL